MDTVGERIKTLRKANDMTQKEFSECIGISRSTLAGYETGKIEPSLNVIFSLANKFDINPSYFLRTMNVSYPDVNDELTDVITNLDELMDVISTQDIMCNNQIIAHKSTLSRLIYFEVKKTRDSIIQTIKILDDNS